MKKRIKALAEGKFEDELLGLRVSVIRIEEMVYKDELLRGSFWIESRDARKIHGVIYTTNSRMRCLKGQFSGRKIEIPYEFYTLGMEENDTNKGEIYIESNAGEFMIPYVVTVGIPYADTSLGKVKNLFHFANLAHEDFQEAYRLFCSRNFRNINMDEQQRFLYAGLAQYHISRDNMEEFLVAVNKKEKVSFQLAQKQAEYISGGESFQKSILITKSGWGNLSMQVQAEERFIRIEKNSLTADDFVGNNYLFEFLIDEQGLHAGKNYGRIVFANVFQQETLELKVIVPRQKKNNERKMIKKLEEELCHLYFGVRDKAIHNLNWIRDSLRCVESILGLGVSNELYQLFQAQLLVMAKKKEAAAWILDDFSEKQRLLKRQKPEVYAYLQYVRALERQDAAFTEQVLGEIRSLSEIYRDSFRLVWIRLFIDEELETNKTRKYRLLKEQFDMGCRSPFLYMETYLLIKKDSTLLNRLDDFEVRVLNFAMRQAVMEEDLADKAAGLALFGKKFEPMVFRLLTSCYYLFGTASCVEAVCSMLIKGNKRSAVYFEWFERGVANKIKITQLFEYYLYSIPQDKKELLPKTLLMYFSYENSLDYKRKAYLYANVWRYKTEIPDIFETYKPQIELFVVRQVLKKHISEDLAYLYEQLADVLFQHEEARNIMEELMFTCKLLCTNRNILRVVVRYRQLEKEEVFPVTEGTAWIRLYTGSGKILLEDTEGKRHLQTIPYEKYSLFQEVDIAKYALEFKMNHLGLLLNRYEKTGFILKDNNYQICEKLLEYDGLKIEFRQELLKKLIQYHQAKEAAKPLEDLLKSLDFSMMQKKERAFYLEAMMDLGLYDEAFQIILTFGPEEIGIKKLVRLCSRKIQAEIEDEDLLQLCYYVFANKKYDETVLEYLTRYYYGTTWQMQKLWSAARNFEVETYDICERILIQMLFTQYLLGDSGKIFADYYNSIADRDVVLAYLSYFSYQYVVHGQLVDQELFVWLSKECQQQEEINDACRLALLKYYSETGAVPKEQISLLQGWLEYFLDKRICLSFFPKLAPVLARPYCLMEKTVIEHRTDHENRVFLHYRLVSDRAAGAYETVPMNHAFGGLFVKDLAVFCGEKVQYYILEKQDMEQQGQITKSAILDNQYEIGKELDGRYEMINEMYISYALEDEITLRNLMENYIRTEAITEALLELK